MAGGNAVAAGMKDEGLTLVVLVLLNFAHENNMVAAVMLTHFAADELRNRAVKKRHASGRFLKFDSGKLIRQRSRELSRKMMLASLQNVHCKMSSVGEINEAGGLPRQAPEDQWRIQGNRRKGVDGHAYLAPVGGARRYYRYTCGKLTKRPPVITP